MKSLATLLALTFAVTLHAQPQPDPANYEPVLVPVYFFGPGAHGSMWVTKLDVTNSGNSEVVFPRAYFHGDPVCPAVCGCGPITRVEMLQVKEVCSIYQGTMGLLLWVPKESLQNEEIHVTSRVLDTTRQAESAGTEIPTIRLADLKGDRLVLVDVPLDSRFRAGIRAYDIYGEDGATVLMRIYDHEELRKGQPDPLVETTLTLSQPIRNIVPEPFPGNPAFLHLGDLAAAYPQLAGVKSVTIELHAAFSIADPPKPTGRFWAFSTITNNDTQEITIVTPRR